MPILIISDPETGKSERIELEEARMSSLTGHKIGDIIDGATVNMEGRKLEFTGGTDKDGIPMRPDVHGMAKVDILLRGNVGYKPKNKGERKRKLVRGNTISRDTTYLNFVIVESHPSEKNQSQQEEEEEKEETNQEE
jgi:small subunit ribosomal protein S6e